MRPKFQFKQGDPVWWLSQAGGYTKKRHGIVVAVVGVGERATDAFYRYYQPDVLRLGVHPLTLGDTEFYYSGGLPRKHESYLVLVQDGNKKPLVFWPVVSKLRLEKETR